MHSVPIEWRPLIHGLLVGVDSWPWWTMPFIGVVFVVRNVASRGRRRSHVR